LFVIAVRLLSVIGKFRPELYVVYSAEKTRVLLSGCRSRRRIRGGISGTVTPRAMDDLLQTCRLADRQWVICRPKTCRPQDRQGGEEVRTGHHTVTDGQHGSQRLAVDRRDRACGGDG